MDNSVFNYIVTIINGSAQELNFDEATHSYTYHGQKIYSATTIMNQITHYKFQDIPQAVLMSKARTGTMCHRYGEILFYKQKLISVDEYLNQVDPLFLWGNDYRVEIRGYHESMLRFWQEYQPNFFASEIKFYDAKQNLAGIIDALEYDDNRGFVICDYKTSATIDPFTQILQLVAYGTALNNILGQEVFEWGKLIQLKKDGTYRIYVFELKTALNRWELLLRNWDVNIKPILENKK